MKKMSRPIIVALGAWLIACQSPATRDRVESGVATISHGATISTIRIDPDTIRHAASPYVMSFNRNHNHRQFERHRMNQATLNQAMRQLSPTWGDAYLQGLQRAGYPAKTTAKSLYRNGHGPTDGRLDYPELSGYRFQEMWNRDGRPNSWDGYCYDDIRYFLSEARDWHAETLVTVNFGSDDALSAGSLAAYLNRPNEPLKAQYPLASIGQFNPGAALPQSFMFEIGNELQLRQQIGHARAQTIAQYVQEAAPYIQQIRHQSPFPVKIALAAAVNIFWGGPAGWEQQSAMIDSFVNACTRSGVAIDALQYHGYPKYPVNEKLAGPTYADQLIATELLPALARAPQRLEIWNDECHAASPTPRNTGMYGVLHQAATIAYAFNRSFRGDQLTPIITDFALWHAGKTNGNDSLYFQNNSATQTTPLYAFRRLLASRWGDWVIDSAWDGNEHWQDLGQGSTRTRVPGLLVSASLSTDQQHLYLLVINQTRAQAIQTQLTWPARWRLGSGTCARLNARSGIDAWNAAWNEVNVTPSQPFQCQNTQTWPAASVSLVSIPVLAKAP